MSKTKFCILCSIILISVLFLFTLNLSSSEQDRFKIRPWKLVALDQENEFQQEYTFDFFDTGKKGNIIVFSATTGYEDANGIKYLPWSKVSLKKAKKIIFRVDLTCTKTAKLGMRVYMVGPDSRIVGDVKSFNVKRNVYYKMQFELNITGAGVDTGIYDIVAIVYPAQEEVPMTGSGGMTMDTSRVEVTK